MITMKTKRCPRGREVSLRNVTEVKLLPPTVSNTYIKIDTI